METRCTSRQEIIRSAAAKSRAAKFLFFFATVLAVIGIPPTRSGQFSSRTPAEGPVSDSSQLHFRVSGAPGAAYVVQASRDLSAWTPVVTNTVSGAGYFNFRSEERRVGKECRSRWSPYH